jgi:chromosome segregation ATPase
MDNYSQNNLTDEDKHRKRNDLQREKIMAESDLHHVTNEKILIEAEERKIRKEIDHLKMDLQDKQHRLQAIDQDIIMKQSGISHLKKEINLS